MDYLVTNEWGWLGYEELSRSRRVDSYSEAEKEEEVYGV